MKRIKMVGLDLDGTLLNDKKELTSYTKNVLEKECSDLLQDFFRELRKNGKKIEK